MTHQGLIAALLVAGLVGCGGVIDPAPAGTGAPSPSGTTAPTTSPGTPPTSSPTTSTPPGEPPPSASCTLSHDYLTIELSGAIDVHCPRGTDTKAPAPAAHLIGAITAVAEDSFTLDTCPPTADCRGPGYVENISVHARGLDLRALRIGSYVKVDAVAELSWSCLRTISVVSVGEWAGARNPVDGDGHLYLVAQDGVFRDIAGLRVSRVEATGCPITPSDCGPITPYALQLSAPSGSTVVVQMGTSMLWAAPGSGEGLSVRNLRSYAQDKCADASWSYGWYAVTALLGV